jgi:hypothetical protein
VESPFVPGNKMITNNKVSNSLNGLTIYRGFDGNRVLIEGGII